MNRLLVAAASDVRLQYRQGFYAAAAFAGFVMIVVLRLVPAEELPWLLPIIVLGNVQMDTFFFIAGLLLLEKTEGTLEALVVTPLRPLQYIGSKVITLTALSVVENLVIVRIVHGPGFDVVACAAAIVVASVVFALAGFIMVVRYESINEFLMPSFPATMALTLPFLPYLEIADGFLFRLHPIDPALFLMRDAFTSVSPARWWILGVSGAFWIPLGVALSLRAFRSFVVANPGRSRP